MTFVYANLDHFHEADFGMHCYEIECPEWNGCGFFCRGSAHLLISRGRRGHHGLQHDCQQTITDLIVVAVCERRSRGKGRESSVTTDSTTSFCQLTNIEQERNGEVSAQL